MLTHIRSVPHRDNLCVLTRLHIMLDAPVPPRQMHYNTSLTNDYTHQSALRRRVNMIVNIVTKNIHLLVQLIINTQ